MKTHRLAAGLLAAAASASAAYAQQEPDGFSAGIGVGYANSVFVDDDSTAQALPLIRYDTPQFSLGLPDGARVTLFGDDQLRLSAVLAPRFSALDDADSLALDGIERDVTLDGGAQLVYRFGAGTLLRVRALTELTDEHGGQELGAEISQPVPLGRQILLASAGATWLSGDLAQYTYGVLPGEAIAGRPSYDPGSVVIPHISLSTVFPVSERARIIGSVRAEFLPDAVTDSPIVDADVGISSFVGLSFQF